MNTHSRNAQQLSEAEEDVRDKSLHLEQAFEGLKSSITHEADQAREQIQEVLLKEVEDTLTKSEVLIDRFFSDVRASVETQWKELSKKPIQTALAVLGIGAIAGYLVAKKSQARELGSLL